MSVKKKEKQRNRVKQRIADVDWLTLQMPKRRHAHILLAPKMFQSKTDILILGAFGSLSDAPKTVCFSSVQLQGANGGNSVFSST